MHIEDFWESVEVAANAKVEELNTQIRFHFMLHADKKSKAKWEDLPLPFPGKKEENASKTSGNSNSMAVSQNTLDMLPPELLGKTFTL